MREIKISDNKQTKVNSIAICCFSPVPIEETRVGILCSEASVCDQRKYVLNKSA